LRNKTGDIMRKIFVGITLACCLIGIGAVQGKAQTRKAGLWELTTTQTFQRSPFPDAGSPPSTPHTTEVCLTQPQIEKYGAIVPHIPGCRITNVMMKPGGMTGEMECNSHMNGKATLESSSSDGIHASGKIHFVGSLGTGADAKPMEWTTHSSAIFKSADCGNVQPAPMPDN
jgi:hypothetical protein